MESAKTLNLLAVAHNYERKGMKVALLKPLIDVRFSSDEIASRVGLRRKADLLLSDDCLINFKLIEDVHCILVDEAQFLSPFIIDQLRRITLSINIPVICYGLRTDFRKNLFEGSRRLFEVADTIEEIKTICSYCQRKAIFNMRLENGSPTIEGAKIDLGGEEKYAATCASCYEKLLEPFYKTSISLVAKEV